MYCTSTVHILYKYCTYALAGICYAPFLHPKIHRETPAATTCWFITKNPKSCLASMIGCFDDERFCFDDEPHPSCYYGVTHPEK